jgi:hypothetical protein
MEKAGGDAVTLQPAARRGFIDIRQSQQGDAQA